MPRVSEQEAPYPGLCRALAVSAAGDMMILDGVFGSLDDIPAGVPSLHVYSRVATVCALRGSGGLMAQQRKMVHLAELAVDPAAFVTPVVGSVRIANGRAAR